MAWGAAVAKKQPKEKAKSPMKAGSEFVHQWLDQKELTIKSEAKQAGFLGHGTMVGSAREFLVSNVLRSILPPTVHVCSGRIIGSTKVSKQIDIILYDSRCPMMEFQPGNGVYFSEGVIGTIEVKSQLDRKNLKDALNNCASVFDEGSTSEISPWPTASHWVCTKLE